MMDCFWALHLAQGERKLPPLLHMMQHQLISAARSMGAHLVLGAAACSVAKVGCDAHADAEATDTDAWRMVAADCVVGAEILNAVAHLCLAVSWWVPLLIRVWAWPLQPGCQKRGHSCHASRPTCKLQAAVLVLKEHDWLLPQQLSGTALWLLSCSS